MKMDKVFSELTSLKDLQVVPLKQTIAKLMAHTATHCVPDLSDETPFLWECNHFFAWKMLLLKHPLELGLAHPLFAIDVDRRLGALIYSYSQGRYKDLPVVRRQLGNSGRMFNIGLSTLNHLRREKPIRIIDHWMGAAPMLMLATSLDSFNDSKDPFYYKYQVKLKSTQMKVGQVGLNMVVQDTMSLTPLLFQGYDRLLGGEDNAEAILRYRQLIHWSWLMFYQHLTLPNHKAEK